MSGPGAEDSYRAPGLAWLFVLAYAAHVAEEWFGGFPEWFAMLAGSPLPRDRFLVLNLIGLAAMAAAVAAGTRRASLGWLVIAVAAAALLNSFAHVVASILTGSYSPGLLTGAAFWLPLGHVVLVRAWGRASRSRFFAGIAGGLAAHAVVTLAALGASR